MQVVKVELEQVGLVQLHQGQMEVIHILEIHLKEVVMVHQYLLQVGHLVLEVLLEQVQQPQILVLLFMQVEAVLHLVQGLQEEEEVRVAVVVQLVRLVQILTEVMLVQVRI